MGFLDDLIMFFEEWALWFIKFTVSIIKLFVGWILDGIVELLKIAHEEIVLEVIDHVHEIYNNPIFVTYFNDFTVLGISILTLLTLYQIIKSLFIPLGFDGDSPLNIIINYVVFYILICTLFYFATGILAFTQSLVQNITIDSLNFNISSNIDFTGEGNKSSIDGFLGSIQVLITQLALDLLTITILVLVFFKFVETAARIIQRVAMIMITIILGPLAVSVGIVKSQRPVAVAWFKSFFLGCLTYYFMIVIYSFTIAFLNASSGTSNFTMIIRTLGFLYAIKAVESVVQSVMLGEGGVGGYTDGGFSKKVMRKASQMSGGRI